MVASRGSYGAKLAAAGGLGSTAGFARALPDLDHAFAAVYVNGDAVLDAAKSAYGEASAAGPSLDLLRGIAVAGFTISQDSSGDLTARLRVSTTH